jgi:hypothetical protein
LFFGESAEGVCISIRKRTNLQMANNPYHMKHIYRIFFLVLLFCAFAKNAAAAGHTVSLSPMHALCFNQCSGAITTTVSGGVGPFAYAWSSGQTTANITALCAGVYTVTVTDMSDMSIATASVTIIAPQPVTVTPNVVVGATCNQCNGSASVMVAGGVAPYTFMWSPQLITTQNLVNACAGTYTIMVTDANGCTATGIVTIANNGGPVTTTVTASPNVICAGQTSALSIAHTGGTAPFTYQWTNPNSSLSNPTVQNPVASPTVTTTYSCTITDANMCQISDVVTVTVNPAVAGNITYTDPTCNQSNGSLTVTVTQAAPPYSLVWSNGPTTPVNSNVPAGAYAVLITDNNGCSLSLSQGLSNIGGPAVTMSATNTGCTNSSTGTATATVTGLSPFTYLWNTVPAQTTATATGLAMGNYLVAVTDSAGCVTTSPVQINSVTGNLYLYASWTTPSNCNQPTGSVTSFIQGGTMPYAYAWSSGSTAASDSQLVTGTYSLTVTDANGCTQSGSVAVPAICANLVQGRIYNDVNQNLMFDAGDVAIPGAMILVSPGQYATLSDASGAYSIFINASGTYTVTPTYSSAFQVADPVAGVHQAVFASLGDTMSNADFVLQAPVQFQDLFLSLASGPARPGFTQNYSILCQNRGTTVVSDTIWFQHDTLLTLINANPAFDGYAHPQGYWLFSNFAPGQSMLKSVNVQVPTIPNGGYIGRSLFASARIEPTSLDSSSPDNGDDETDIITASYDPNLKECWSPTMNAGGDIWPTDITLDYTIHFQNTGTDTAFTVVVVDTLPAELDITTFRIGASSHACTYSLNGANNLNVLTFTFMNILLPDSNVNEAASHGYVQFTIDRFANLPIGTTIPNEANNYFDFNPAIVTNTNVLTIVNPLSVEESSGNGVTVYPNPAQSSVNVVLSGAFSGSTTVTLRDISGRVITSAAANGSTQLTLNTEGCAAGMYFITVQSADAETITRQLIISEK